MATSPFLTGLLRIPSINALEVDPKKADFQRLIGLQPKQGVKVFSPDAIADVFEVFEEAIGSPIRNFGQEKKRIHRAFFALFARDRDPGGGFVVQPGYEK